MAAISVSGTAVPLDTSAYPDLRKSSQTLVIQNLGPGILYIDSDAEVTTTTGIKLEVGLAWEVTSYDPSRPVYAISSGTSDVRFTALD